MQKFISRYALAAHLSILAVAPLFLSAFIPAALHSTVLLWLSFIGLLWIFTGPSRRQKEYLFEARERVLKSIAKDPFFWLAVLITVFSGVRALNVTEGVVYNIEKSTWEILSPPMVLFPFSFPGKGFLEFSTAVAFVVVFIGCKYALGRKARLFFAVASSILAGGCALASVLCYIAGYESILTLVSIQGEQSSYLGESFSIFLVLSVISFCCASQLNSANTFFMLIISTAFLAAATLLFSPGYALVPSLGVVLFSVVLVLPYIFRASKPANAFKGVVSILLSFLISVILILSIVPGDFFESRLPVFFGNELIQKSFLENREMLSPISMKIWAENLWLGSGVGSYFEEFRFAASPRQLSLFGVSEVFAHNGFWQLLAERGVIGAGLIAVALAMILFAWMFRFVKAVLFSFSKVGRPFVATVDITGFLPFLVLAVPVFTGFFDNSYMRFDVLVPLGALFALAANSIHIKKSSTADNTEN